MNRNDILAFGLHSKAPDLIENMPGLGKLKNACPKYIKRANQAQAMARQFARDEIYPRVLDIDAKCAKDPTYFDWELWEKANSLKLNIAGLINAAFDGPD
jgi:hypothetical protein